MNPQILILTFYFILGAAIGSFLNVWSRRLLRGQSPTGRSRCENCKHVLGFFDLIPLLSFADLRGRCRYCHKPLSWQYPIVEFGTGLLFAALAFKQLSIINYQLTNILAFSFLLLVSSALIVIFITDFRRQVIFDQVLWVGGAAALLYRLLIHDFQLAELAPDLLTAFAAFGFFWAIRALTRGRGMGEGDPPLGFVTALLVGFPAALVELFAVFVLGGVTGAVLVLGGRKRLKDRIAFGPFLVAATFLTIFFGEALFDLYLGILGL